MKMSAGTYAKSILAAEDARVDAGYPLKPLLYEAALDRFDSLDLRDTISCSKWPCLDADAMEGNLFNDSLPSLSFAYLLRAEKTPLLSDSAYS